MAENGVQKPIESLKPSKNAIWGSVVTSLLCIIVIAFLIISLIHDHYEREISSNLHWLYLRMALLAEFTFCLGFNLSRATHKFELRGKIKKIQKEPPCEKEEVQ